MLSLNLLLLAFFILLNALSNFETDRSRAVLRSVNAAFNGKVDVDESVLPLSAALGPLQESAKAVKAIGELFQSLLPSVEVSETAQGDVMSVTLDAGQIFEPGATKLLPGRAPLLDRLVRILAAGEADGLSIMVELRHGYDPERRQELGPRSLPVERVGVLSRALVERGLAGAETSAGLDEGSETELRLVFRLRTRAREPLDFASLLP